MLPCPRSDREPGRATPMPPSSDDPRRAIAITASVVVCVYNRADQVGPCLESLIAQDGPPAELVVVNDGSTDATARVLEEFRLAHPGRPIVVVHNPTNLGLSAARNVGIEAASGKYILFTDSDCTVARN